MPAFRPFDACRLGLNSWTESSSTGPGESGCQSPTLPSPTLLVGVPLPTHRQVFAATDAVTVPLECILIHRLSLLPI
jgi:hypothetical protein